MYPGDKIQIIELKCESLWQNNAKGGKANYVNAMKKDIVKIISVLNELS